MLNGVINVYKEKGFTSHDVVAKLRGILKQKKIGHTGTLDPDAEGVLPVCLGKGTKLCDMLTDKDKTYEVTLLLGVSTDTQDTSGTLIERKAVEVTPIDVEQVILSFIGDYEQIPPMYSALKVNGKKLYELAREGKEIERSPRLVHIRNIKITEMKLPYVKMTVECSKGTYMRTLCYDIGVKLGCGGCMDGLLRTRVSYFQISESLTLSQIEELRDKEQLDTVIIPIDAVFHEYPKCVVAKEYNHLIYNGNIFSMINLTMHDPEITDHPVRVFDETGNFIGIYRYDYENGYFKIVKMFYDPSSSK